MIPVGGMSTWERVYDEGVSPRPCDTELDSAGLLFGILFRFDLMQQYGDRDQLLHEIRELFGHQAAQTGTLWEHATSQSSCNHGFASCACDYIAKAGSQSGLRPQPRALGASPHISHSSCCNAARRDASAARM